MHRGEATMHRFKWVMSAVFATLTSAWLCVYATASVVIPATEPSTLKLRVDTTTGLPFSGEPTVSLYQLDDLLPSTVTLNSPSRCTRIGTVGLYRDVTDCWLPQLGVPVFVAINGSTATATLTLVGPSSVAANTFPLSPTTPNPFLALNNPTTSAYPGQCTNFGTGTLPDFTAADGSLTMSPVSLTTPTG